MIQIRGKLECFLRNFFGEEIGGSGAPEPPHDVLMHVCRILLYKPRQYDKGRVSFDQGLDFLKRLRGQSRKNVDVQKQI